MNNQQSTVNNQQSTVNEQQSTVNEQQLTVGGKLRQVWGNGRWIVRLVRQTDRRLLWGLVGMTLVLSILPAALAVVVRGLVNEVAAVLAGESETAAGLLLWLGLGLVVTLVETVGNFINRYLGQRLNDELNLRITGDILAHAARLDVAYFENSRFQDMMERAQQNTAQRFSRFVTNSLAVATNMLQVFSLTVILVVIEPLVVVALVPLAVPYLWFQWRLAQARFAKEDGRATQRRWTRYFVSRLTGQAHVPEAKLLNLGPLLRQKFFELMRQFRDQDRQIYRRALWGNSLFAVVSATVFYATFVRVAFRVLAGGLTIGDVAIYGGATARLRTALESGIQALTGAMEQTLHIANLQAFLALEPVMKRDGRALSHSRGEIEMQDVRFTYDGGSRPALRGVSLHITPGETVAIVGENGAGKTTLVKLLARLYPPDSGRILFDGEDVRSLSLDDLYSKLSFVFQRFGRYEATVGDNIAYGNWEKLLDDAGRIEEIARLAGAEEMIAGLPDGYETLLGRMFGEVTLSSGQWQKLAIARAFARDASLLILDEPTANLDARAEYRIFTNFRQLAQGRTTILISHRFSTVSMADRILVMADGRIVEHGTHTELLELDGHYARLYELHRRQLNSIS